MPLQKELDSWTLSNFSMQFYVVICIYSWFYVYHEEESFGFDKWEIQ
jgi:hypothetical protein